MNDFPASAYVFLHPCRTFEEFVVGPSNQEAYDKARSISQGPQPKRVLWIYGEPGVGKTHLLQAIAHSIITLYSAMPLCYVGAEEFAQESIAAFKDPDAGVLRDFYVKYGDLEFLLIDSIQLFLGSWKRRSWKRFGKHGFLFVANDIIKHDGEVPRYLIVTADRPPSQFPSDVEGLAIRPLFCRQTTDVVKIESHDQALQFAIQRHKKRFRRARGRELPAKSLVEGPRWN